MSLYLAHSSVKEFEKELNRSPITLDIWSNLLDYRHFESLSSNPGTPIIFLTGIFQNIESFKGEIELLRYEFPIYILDLPGLGTNSQLNPELKIKDYCQLIEAFMDRVGLTKANFVGHSFTSQIAYHFGCYYQNRCKNLVLNRMGSSIKKSARYFFLDSVKTLKKEGIKKFAKEMAINVLNYNRRNQISQFDENFKSFYKNLLSLGPFDQKRYVQYIDKFISSEVLPLEGPECPVLFLSGEFDRNITSFETSLVSKRCPNSWHGIVENSDHLYTMERKKVIQKVYRLFLSERSFEYVQGLQLYKGDYFPEIKMELDTRIEWNENNLIETESGSIVAVDIVNINSRGMKFYTSLPNYIPVGTECLLHAKIGGQELKFKFIVFDRTKDSFRALFRHSTFKEAQLLEQLIMDICIKKGLDKQDSLPQVA